MSKSRWSVQQRRVIHSGRVQFVGVDDKNRPVVYGKIGPWGPEREWALLRSGDPADVAEPIQRIQEVR